MEWTPTPDNGIDVPEWKCQQPLKAKGTSISLLTFRDPDKPFKRILQVLQKGVAQRTRVIRSGP